MNEFKIESNIPLPANPDPEATEFDVEDEPTSNQTTDRWVPYKPNQPKCANDKHWPMVGKCEKCGDIFPCPSGNCGHLDCADPSESDLDCEGNGTAVPEWLRPRPNVIETETPVACSDSPIKMPEGGFKQDFTIS